MVVKYGLSQFQSSISRGALNTPSFKPPSSFSFGKVFGVVLGENIPSKEAFEAVGGWNGIGAVFYIDYESSKNLVEGEVSIEDCTVAFPLDPNIRKYPLLGEVIILLDATSFNSQFNSAVKRKYYLGSVGIWNNIQQNAPYSITLGKTFVEKKDIRPLLPFEGDIIIQGRKGNGIRFGTTVSARSNENEWSMGSTPQNDGDPITILVNGYITSDTGSAISNVEEINKEMSSIYMTSTQKIPLQPGALIENPVFSSLSPTNYINSQLILNSDRVTINSKKDEILLFATTDIEINTDNRINLNAGKHIHLHIDPNNSTSKILLGTKTDNTLPDEPVLLGNQTVILMEKMITTLNALASYLSTAVSSDGSPIPSVNNAGDQLFNDTKDLCDQLLKITSSKVYTT